MVDYVDAALFNDDSLDKQIHIAIQGTQSVLGNEDIVSESFQLIESLCSEENLKFGAVEPRCVKFTVKYSAPTMLNKWLTITMSLHGSNTPFQFGDYQVLSDKPSTDRTTRDITAYSHFHKILKNTYKNWYKGAWGSSDSMTIKEFRDSFFARLHQTHSWVVQETTTLPNDNVVIKKSKKIPRISGKDILNAICEINGVFGYIGRDNVFHYIMLQDTANPHEITNTYLISAEYEDYSTMVIDRVQILSEDGDILGDAGDSAEDAENPYTINNNFMLKGLGTDGTAVTTCETLAANLIGVLSSVTYVPMDANFKGNPCFEVGDEIIFHAHGNEIHSHILERTMTGIQSLRDNYVSQGEETYPEDSNTLSSRISKVENAVGNVDLSKSTNNVGSSDVSTIDADNGDTYFKFNNDAVMYLKYSASNTTVSNLQQNDNGEASFDVTTVTDSEHRTIIFQIDNLVVNQHYSLYLTYQITQWIGAGVASKRTWGFGFSDLYPTQDENGYSVANVSFPNNQGEGTSKHGYYDGHYWFWVSFKSDSSRSYNVDLNGTFVPTATTMYLYFNADTIIPDGITFKWSLTNMKFTPAVNLADHAPEKEISEIYSNVDGEWYKYNGNINYSTQEQDTGTKWIDGKTIYQKTVATGGSVPTGGTLIQRIEHAQTGYDTIFYTKS